MVKQCGDSQDVAKNGTVDYKVVFAHPPKVNDPIDDVLRTQVENVVSKLPVD